jgi:hypothetical protein
MRIPFIYFLVVAMAGTGCSASVGTVPSNAVPPVVSQTASTPATSPSPVAGLPTAMPPNSIYTDLNEKACKEAQPSPDEDGIIYKADCPGTAGYKVTNLSTEHTQGLIITDPTGKTHKIDFRGPLGTVADLFLGDKIEWRKKDSKPYSFIIRVNVQKQPGNSDKQDSNLAIVKLAPDGICVTDFVKPSEKDQNVKARELSDTSASRPCLKSKME